MRINFRRKRSKISRKKFHRQNTWAPIRLTPLMDNRSCIIQKTRGISKLEAGQNSNPNWVRNFSTTILHHKAPSSRIILPRMNSINRKTTKPIRPWNNRIMVKTFTVERFLRRMCKKIPWPIRHVLTSLITPKLVTGTVSMWRSIKINSPTRRFTTTSLSRIQRVNRLQMCMTMDSLPPSRDKSPSHWERPRSQWTATATAITSTIFLRWVLKTKDRTRSSRTFCTPRKKMEKF